MTEPSPMTNPVRLDDLIEAIKKVAHRRPRPALRRGARRRPPRRRRRPPDRPLRRPGPPLRRLVDRDRPQHGRHQAGRAEAVRAQGRGDRRTSTRARASAVSPPRARNVVVAAQNEARPAGNDRDRPGAPGARPAQPSPRRSPRRRSSRRAWRSTPSARRVTATLPPAADDGARARSRSTRRRRKALELTFREALRLGHNYIGTEHILLALLELEDLGKAAAARGLGLTKPAVEGHIAGFLAEVIAAAQAAGPDGDTGAD